MAEYNLAQVVMLLRRYGPLMEYLENATRGYGKFTVSMHGRVPRKVARLGQETLLAVLDDDDIELDISG